MHEADVGLDHAPRPGVHAAAGLLLLVLVAQLGQRALDVADLIQRLARLGILHQQADAGLAPGVRAVAQVGLLGGLTLAQQLDHRGLHDGAGGAGGVLAGRAGADETLGLLA